MSGICQCPECNQFVKEEDMRDTTGKLCYHAYACSSCYEELESDDED